MIRVFLFTLMLLIFQNSIIIAQKSNSKLFSDSFHMQELVIKKNVSQEFKRNKESFYLAFNYNFSDTISILIENKNIYNGRIEYLEADSNSTLYPYNRKLLKFSKNKIHQKSKCQIIFWESKKIVDFYLYRRISYYTLDMLKNKPVWFLNLLNVYPWSD